jgi:hypothetical protein
MRLAHSWPSDHCPSVQTDHLPTQALPRPWIPGIDDLAALMGGQKPKRPPEVRSTRAGRLLEVLTQARFCLVPVSLLVFLTFSFGVNRGILESLKGGRLFLITDGDSVAPEDSTFIDQQ